MTRAMTAHFCKRQRVLVVDDDPVLRAGYRRFFEEGHSGEFRPVLVADAEQALTVLGQERVDVVILAWNLHGLTGIEFAKALRDGSKTRSIGIVMITSRKSSADMIRALAAGADDYLTTVSYTHLRAHETGRNLVCRLLLEKK